jgi:hypothetical protein
VLLRSPVLNPRRWRVSTILTRFEHPYQRGVIDLVKNFKLDIDVVSFVPSTPECIPKNRTLRISLGTQQHQLDQE